MARLVVSGSPGWGQAVRRVVKAISFVRMNNFRSLIHIGNAKVRRSMSSGKPANST